MIKCPVCKQSTGTYLYPGLIPSTRGVVDYPLYQISYKGSPEYLPPRCSSCFDKTLERRKEKEKKESTKPDGEN